MPSQYSAENVSVSRRRARRAHPRGGRLGHVNLGHFLPDYTAYEELLDVFKAFTAIPILLEGERGYAFTADDLRKEIQGRGLSALLLSNPVQPDGQAGPGRGARALGEHWRASSTARCSSTSSTRTTSGRRAPGQLPDGERRPLRRGRRTATRWCIFDGLTKNWRYPGLARDLDGRARRR